MTKDSNGDRGLAGKSEQIKEAQMFASMLQKAIDTGRATSTKMREVDKLVSNRLTTQTAYILQTINNIMDRTRNTNVKERLNKIYLEFLDLFNKFKLMETKGYQTMVRSRRILDTKRFNKLIDLDTELLSIIGSLYNSISKFSLKKSISIDKCHEMLEMIDDILSALERRHELIETIY